MKHQIQVKLAERSYPIQVERNGSTAFLKDLIQNKKVHLVTDTHTKALFAEKYIQEISKYSTVSLSVFTAGEQSKRLGTVENICRDAVKAGLDRTSVFVALGGGICGDMTGLAASLYMRGTQVIQIPTTLLAMVDSSVGGKTGVDLPEGKNLIGTFFQPCAVLIDPENLRTLPAKQLSNGFAELVKTAMILDKDLVRQLESEPEALFQLAPDSPVEQIIARCCELKAQVVSQDETEKGMRALLNYGHTFGHALETVTRYERFEHGEAVAVGMSMAADLSQKLGLLSTADAKRQNDLLKAFALPTDARGMDLNADELFSAMHHDKKNSGGKLKIVLCDAAGHAGVYEKINDNTILEVIRGRI